MPVFDIANLAGTFAASGLAIGAIGGILAPVVSGIPAIVNIPFGASLTALPHLPVGALGRRSIRMPGANRYGPMQYVFHDNI